MKLHVASRILIASAMSVPAIIGISSVPSIAATSTTSSPAVTCLRLVIKGTITGFSGDLSKCSDTANTDGVGIVKYKLTNYTGTIKWGKNGSFGKTTVSLTYEVVTNQYCPPKYEQYEITSTVTGGTGKAIKSIPVGNRGTSGMCSKYSGWPTPPPKPEPWLFLYKDYSFNV